MKRALVYTVIAILLAYAVRELEYYGIRRSKHGLFAKYNTCFVEKNNYNLLVIGSSRAESHFRPDLLDSATGLNSYNAGMPGATMPFIEGTLEAWLENSAPPEHLILNVDYHRFNASEDTIRQFPGYFPYMSNHALYAKFSERDKRFPWFRWVPFYSMPYFNARYLDNSIRGYLDIPGKYDTTYIKGYTPIPVPAPYDLDTVAYPRYSSCLQPASWKSLQHIIAICKEKNIRLVLVLSPMYHRLTESITNEPQLVAELKAICGKNGLACFDYSLIPMCYDKRYFSDEDHLNRDGALVFSRMFCRDFVQYLAR